MFIGQSHKHQTLCDSKLYSNKILGSKSFVPFECLNQGSFMVSPHGTFYSLWTKEHHAYWSAPVLIWQNQPCSVPKLRSFHFTFIHHRNLRVSLSVAALSQSSWGSNHKRGCDTKQGNLTKRQRIIQATQTVSLQLISEGHCLSIRLLAC